MSYKPPTTSDSHNTFSTLYDSITLSLLTCIAWFLSFLPPSYTPKSLHKRLKAAKPTKPTTRRTSKSSTTTQNGITTPLRRSRRIKEKTSPSGTTTDTNAGSSSGGVTDSDSNASDVSLHTSSSSSSRTAARIRPWGKERVPRGIGRNMAAGEARKTLVLDLDETLIHSTSRGSRNHDHMIEVLVEKHVCLYYVYKRPYCDLFLKTVSEWYKVVIFTASMPEYADPVIDWLDCGRTMVSERYFRQSCTQIGGIYVKDLQIIEPDLRNVCLVDNSPVSFQKNPDNGIPIEGWISDPKDECLLDLLPFLDALRFTDDVRSILNLRI
ncbi:Nuclear envelope morphology protein 1 [Rhizophlyctis rosea]|uniref:Nuclear envelope morphology protein 1 n=1 Tax=Rhizophlyctis rosea TaxID=64517 RepID=A0AAD5X5G0_9FUNG|nr:Nuclear envelope morphology protein 1 [Rhizophlyctis rosea]